LDQLSKKTNLIVLDNNIPFFPSLGNHETYRWLPAFSVRTEAQLNFSTDGQRLSSENLRTDVPKAYDIGEAAGALEPDGTITKVVPNSRAGKKQIEKWMSDIESGSPQEKVEAAFNYGQFEGAVQNQFYKNTSSDERCGGDARTFSSAYIKRAHYNYLKPITADVKRSYYSQVIDAGDLHIKLIALDTNCLDSDAQQNFFRDELSKFQGKVVVFGHHPPTVDDTSGALPWDVVKDWNKFKPYFSSPAGKNIVLWIFGHVHDYQRRAKTDTDNVPAPALVVAGGGGASLDSAVGPFQWQPEDWSKNFKSASAYSYMRMIFTNNSVEIDVFGADASNCPSPSGKPECDFRSIDHFTVIY
jgi:hypothetical protein